MKRWGEITLVIAFLIGEQPMEQALRVVCGRDKEKREDGQGQSEDAVVSLPHSDDHCSYVHGRTGWVGTGTRGGRVHRECTGWVVPVGCSLYGSFLGCFREEWAV